MSRSPVGPVAIAPPTPLPPDAQTLYWSHERYRCAQDLPYLSSRYLRIKAKEEIGLPTLTLNRPQQYLHERCMDQLKRTGRIRQVWGKCRQVGATTYGRALTFQQTAFRPHRTGMLLAHDEPSSTKLFDMDKTFYDGLPTALQPTSKYRSRWRMTYDALHSEILVGHALNMNVGASQTYHLWHLTELARFRNADEVQASLFPAFSDAKGDDFSVGIIESTSRIGGEWFKDFAEAAQRGENGYEFVFVPWFWHEAYRRPVPKGWHPTSEEREWLRQYPDLTKENLVWYRQKRSEYLTNQALVFQEYAFDWTSSWVLPEGTLRTFKEEFVLTTEDHLRPGRRMRASSEGLVEQLGGPIECWQLPVEGVFYDLGVDLAGSRQARDDWTVCEVVRRDTLEQVAEARLRVDPAGAEFLDTVYWLAMAYNTAQINPDTTGGWGAALLSELQHRGYPNLWQRRQRDSLQSRLAPRVGFVFTDKDKAYLVNNAVILVTRGMPVVHSEALVEEMRHYLTVGVDEWQAGPGHHDDTVCMPAGTPVLTPSGVSVSIADVRCGDSVVSYLGVERRVMNTGTRIAETLVGLEICGLIDEVRCTPEHPILIARPPRYRNGGLKWTHVNSQRVGLAWQPFSDDGVWRRADEAMAGDFAFIPKRNGLQQTEIPEDLLYLIGWYMADGNLTPMGQLRICFGGHEQRPAKRIADIITRFNEQHPSSWIAGYGSRKHHRQKVSKVLVREVLDGRMIAVETSSKWLAKFLTLAAGPAKHKRVHPALFQSSGLLPLAVGFLEGDGSQRVTSRGDISATQKNAFVLSQVRQILLDSGVWVTEMGITRDGQAMINVPAPSVNAMLTMFPGERFSFVDRLDARRLAYETERGYWTPVQRTRVIDWGKPVYNLTVDTDESYIGGGIAVHNCAWMLALLAARDEWREGWTSPRPTAATTPPPPPAWKVQDMAADLEPNQPKRLVVTPWRV